MYERLRIKDSFCHQSYLGFDILQFGAASIAVENQGVRAVLLPLNSVVKDGQIILTAQLKFKNPTKMPAKDIVATAFAGEGVEVNPTSVSLAYLGGHSEAVAETVITIKSPELKNQKKANGRLVWHVNYRTLLAR